MLEPALNLRPDETRCLQFLLTDSLQHQVQHLQEERDFLVLTNQEKDNQVDKLREEKQEMTIQLQSRDLEIQRLQDALDAKTAENKKIQSTFQTKLALMSGTKRHSSASKDPFPDLPEWMNPDWQFKSTDRALLWDLAGRIQCQEKMVEALELAEHLRRVYLGEKELPLSKHSKQYLDVLSKCKGITASSKPLELLMLACLAMTHSRAGTVNLISTFQYTGHPIRGKDTIE